MVQASSRQAHAGEGGYDPSERSTGDHLRDWAAVMRELRKRDVIRTNNNPVEDIAGGDRGFVLVRAIVSPAAPRSTRNAATFKMVRRSRARLDPHREELRMIPAHGVPVVLEFAQKAFIVRDDRLLLVQKSPRDPEQPYAWEVPGGRLQPGEDLDAHICREVFEEVGLAIEPGAPFAMWDWTMRSKSDPEARLSRVIAVARRCRAMSSTLDLSHRVSDDYLGDARWVEFGDVRGYDLIPSLLPAVQSFLATPSSGR